MALAFCLGMTAPLRAQSPTKQSQKILESTRIKTVPDIEVILTNGQHERVSQLWKDRPLMVTFFFTRCTGSCNPFLTSLKQAVDANGGLGKDYDVLTLSIDPQDTLEDIRARMKDLGIDSDKGWYFGIASPEDISAITDRIDFWYRYDPTRKQFDHPSKIAAIKDGKILRVLMGTTIPPLRFNEIVLDVSGKFIPFYTQPGKNDFLSCFQVDPNTHEVRLHWGMLILVLPGGVAIALALLIFLRAKTGRKKSAR